MKKYIRPILQTDPINFSTYLRRMTRFLVSGSSSGFTLIELLVVIAIIGLLASVVLVALNGARAKSRDAKRIADMTEMNKALELYYNDHNYYPSTTISFGANGSVGPYLLTPTYISQVPIAPTPADNGCTNNAYVYTPYSNGATYSYSFCLGTSQGSISKGPHTLTTSGFQ